MDQNTSLTQNVDALFSNLEGFTQSEGLIGKPVTHSDKTFLPVVSLTLGYGSGNSASKSQPGSSSTISPGMNSMSGAGNMAGGALGLGAKLSTDAVIVIDKDNVSLLSLNSTAAGQLMDKIPQIISGMTGKQQSGQAQGQSQQEQQGQQGQPGMEQSRSQQDQSK